MKFSDTKILLTLDQMYGYHNANFEWIPMKQINRVKKIKEKRIGIWGVGYEGEKMYFQVAIDTYNQLMEQGIFKHELQIEE